MRKFKRIVAGFMCAVMVAGSVQLENYKVTTYAATFDDINDPEMCLTQQESSTCTLAAAAMLMRRYSRIKGDSNWESITEAAIKPVAWAPGLYWSFRYNNIAVAHGSLPADVTQKTNMLIELLKDRPEGIVLYNTVGSMHAVLLTDYTDGKFYCIDPRFGDWGRIPLDSIITNCNLQTAGFYWYINGDRYSLENEIFATDITLDKSSVTINKIGNTIKVNAIVKPDNVTYSDAIWSSSNESVVTVDANGNITAVNNGKAIVRAKAKHTSLVAECEVEVFEPENPNGISLGMDGKEYYFVDGVVDETYTGIVSKGEEKYYVKDGKVLSDYTGVAELEDKNIYVANGKFLDDFTGTVIFEEKEIFVCNGIVSDTVNGLYKKADGKWYCIHDGIVDYEYTGLQYYSRGKGWYYVVDGVVDFDYTGLVYYEPLDTYCYVVKGKMDSTYTNFYLDKDGTWYYVLKGIVDRKVSSVIYYPKNDAYYYVSDGKIDFNYTGLGLCINENKWYYVLNGKTYLNYSSVVYYSENNQYYSVKNGVIDFEYTGFDYNKKDGKWYYMMDGKANLKFTGLAYFKNKDNLYYVKNGVMDLTITDLVYCKADSNWYYVKNGAVAKEFTGYVTYSANNKQYYVENGKMVTIA